jgi:hypothetical protein
MLNRITTQWLAGFFDGEGSIVLAKNHRRDYIRVTIAQNDKSLLEAIRLVYPEFRPPSNNRGSSKCWFILLNGRNAKRFLTDIEPHCVRKHTQVQLALEFIETIDWSRGEKISDETKIKKSSLVDAIYAAREKDSVVLH